MKTPVSILTLLLLSFSTSSIFASTKENFICGIFNDGSEKLIQKIVIDFNGDNTKIRKLITDTDMFSVQKNFDTLSVAFEEREGITRTSLSISLLKKMEINDDPIRVRLCNIGRDIPVDLNAKCYNTKESSIAPFETK